MGNEGEKVGPVQVKVSECPPGDLDCDEKTDLGDAILALRIISGLIPEADLFLENEVNEDGRIGLEEAIFALQEAADLK